MAKRAGGKGGTQELGVTGIHNSSVSQTRHRLYTPELAEQILERVSHGQGIKTICRDEGMPSYGAVQKWIATDHDGFGSRYAGARVRGIEALADELLEIADDGVNDTYVGEDGERRTDHDVIARSRLRVDTRKWLLSKLLPKQYGDRVDLAHTVNMDLSSMSDEELMRIARGEA